MHCVLVQTHHTKLNTMQSIHSPGAYGLQEFHVSGGDFARLSLALRHHELIIVRNGGHRDQLRVREN